MLKYYVIMAFAGLVLLIVFRMARQLLASMRHLDQDTLVEFWNGRLRHASETEYRRVVTHLGTCQECRDRLDDITQNNKTRHNIDDGLINRRF